MFIWGQALRCGSDPQVGQGQQEDDHPDAEAERDRHGCVGVGPSEAGGRWGGGAGGRLIQAPVVGTCGMR